MTVVCYLVKIVSPRILYEATNIITVGDKSDSRCFSEVAVEVLVWL